MGKLVVTEFVSIDGVFEDPGGAEGYEHGGWTFEYDRGEDGDAFKLDELLEAQVQLLGRVTYEGFAAAWPSPDGPFALATERRSSGSRAIRSRSASTPDSPTTAIRS